MDMHGWGGVGFNDRDSKKETVGEQIEMRQLHSIIRLEWEPIR